MADIVTRRELEDAKVDAKDLGKAVNEKVIVSPRYGGDFKSLPLLSDEAQSSINGWDEAIRLITQEEGVPALAVSDSSGKTQQAINNSSLNDVRHISLFSSFVEASNWLKGGVGRLVRLSPGVRYTLPASVDIYFNQYICEQGFAEVIVPDSCNLRYLNKADGSDSIFLEGIRFIVLGKLGNSSGPSTSKWVYHTDQRSTSPVKRVHLKRMRILSLRNVNDPESYFDDVNKTRCIGFLPVEYSEHSHVEDVVHYGLRIFYAYRSSNALATHFEKDIIGFNCETNVAINAGAGYLEGAADNVKIYNTAVQKSYYYNMVNVTNVAGLDAMLVGGKHSGKFTANNIGGKNIIERSLYNQSGNAYLSNIDDDGSYSPLNTKGGEGIVYVRGVTGRNTGSGGGKCPIYGFSYAEWSDFDIPDNPKTVNTCFTFAGGGEYVIKNGTIRNLGTPFYLSTSGGVGIDKITIENVVITNCFTSSRANVWAPLTTLSGNLGELVFKNNVHDVGAAEPSEIFATAFDLKSVLKANIQGGSAVSSNYPFNASDCPDITVKDITFDVLSNTTLYNAFTRMENGVGFKANDFDFKVNFLKTTDVVKIKATARFQGFSESQINCTPSWSEMFFSVPILATGNAARRLFKLDVYSFKAIVTFKQSQLEFIYDAETEAITEIYNVGTGLATSTTAGKISVYVNASDGALVVNFGSGYALGSGELRIKLTR